ncbi:MAG: DNA polymerase Y family protein [Methyloceanibacter sp.]
MSRFVSVFLPQLPLERLARERAARRGAPLPVDRPLALIGTEERGLFITALNEAGRRQGLSAGLGLADARAICPRLLTLPASPKKDDAALRDLARWASCRYSPTLNLDGADGLWLDVSGVPHLFGGESALLADLMRRLARAGFTARLALAETLGGAHALARFAHPSPLVVPAGTIGPALAPLPVEALRLAPEITRLLRRLGLKRIGQLYGLPRASLERRFHAKETAEAVLLRLDQALGRREEPRVPLLPLPDFAARIPLPEPIVTHDGVVAAIERLAIALCEKLARAGQGCRRVALWVARADGSSSVIEAGLSAPSREPVHLLRLFKERIEALDLGFGVDFMSLAALLTEALPYAQTDLTEATEKARPETLIDRLVNRLGPRAVRRLVPRASHIPELAQSLRSAFAGLSPWPEPASRKPQRPPLLFATPEPLTVLAEIPEGPPARFTWRRVTRRVVKSEGPERIAPEWWRPIVARNVTPHPPTAKGGGPHPLPQGERGCGDTATILFPSPLAGEGGDPGFRPGAPGEGASRSFEARPRDYYRIEDEDGHRYWVFREGLYQDSASGSPCWYLHGVFG